MVKDYKDDYFNAFGASLVMAMRRDIEHEFLDDVMEDMPGISRESLMTAYEQEPFVERINRIRHEE